MASILRVLLIATAITIAYLAIMQPRRLRELGRRLQTVAFIYIATVLISAFLQWVGWYPGL